jgi:hypothetical protein
VWIYFSVYWETGFFAATQGREFRGAARFFFRLATICAA